MAAGADGGRDILQGHLGLARGASLVEAHEDFRVGGDDGLEDAGEVLAFGGEIARRAG
jgi:hypothetical protein